MDNINSEAWNKHSERYQEGANFSYEVIDFGYENCLTDNDLNLIGNVDGESILELGCGGANCSIALAKKGANVTAIDISEKQLEFASKNALREDVKINFIQSSMEDLEKFEDESLDKVVSICALPYVKNLDKVLSNVYRMLKKGGEFILSMDHPMFYPLAATTVWKSEELDNNYFYSGESRWKWDLNDEFEFVSYRRPLDEFINKCIDNGFVLKRFHELGINNNQSDEFSVLQSKFPKVMVCKWRK